MSTIGFLHIPPKTLPAKQEKRRRPLNPWEKNCLDIITEVVLQHFDIPEEYYQENYGKDHVSQVRFIMMWYASEELFISDTKIAVYYGFKQHNTVRYACESVNSQRGYDKAYALEVRYICIKLLELELKQPPLPTETHFMYLFPPEKKLKK